MTNFNIELKQQIADAISLQRGLLDKLASACIPDVPELNTINICSKIIHNSIVINKFQEAVDIDNDNEKYETYLKTLDNKDIKIY